MKSLPAALAVAAFWLAGAAHALPQMDAGAVLADFGPHAPLQGAAPAPDPTAPVDLTLPALFSEGALLSGDMLAIEVQNITYTATGEVSSIPLPAAAPLFLLALASLGLAARRWIVA